MFHEQFREARVAAGLSISEVARLAGVPRKQVYELEKGSNVTVETLRRIAAVIPNLKRVTLGGMEVVVDNADLEEARRAALDLFDVAKRLLSALGASPRSPSAARAAPEPAGAVRYSGGTEDDRRAGERVERMVLQQRARSRRKTSKPH